MAGCAPWISMPNTTNRRRVPNYPEYLAEWEKEAEGPPIGANLPDWVLIDTFSRWLAEMTLNALRGGAQCLHVRLGSNRVNERLNDHA